MVDFVEKLKKAQKINEETLLLYKKAQQAAIEKYSKAGSPPKLEEYESTRIAYEAANKAAYDVYQKTHQVNNIKAESAYEEYKKTAENETKLLPKLAEEMRQGKINKEEYERMTQYIKYETETKYQSYLETKKMGDEASHQAYMNYQAIHQQNTEKIKETQNAYSQSSQISLSAPKPSTKTPTPELPNMPTSSKNVAVQSEVADSIYEKFQKTFGEDKWYKDNPSKKSEDGKLNLSFKSEDQMSKFFQDLAKDNKSFIMVDPKSNKVMGYSRDGQLYHANGSEFKDKDKFSPSDKDLDSFKIPEPEPSGSTMQHNQ